MHSILQSMIGQLQAVTPGGCAPIQTVEEQIGTGTSTSNFIPVYGLYDYSWYAAIYLASEFTGGVTTERQITGIEIEIAGYTGGYTYNDQTLKLYQVTQGTFPDSTPNVDLSDLTISNETVVKADFTFTIASNGLQTINFDDNFCYNGTDNLLLVWENRDGTWQSGFGSGKYTSTTNSVGYKFQDNTYPTGAGTRAGLRLNIKFKY